MLCYTCKYPPSAGPSEKGRLDFENGSRYNGLSERTGVSVEYINAAISQDTLTSLCDEFRKNNRIEPEKFEKYQVKRGLRNEDGSGVMAGLTPVSYTHLVRDGQSCQFDSSQPCGRLPAAAQFCAAASGVSESVGQAGNQRHRPPDPRGGHQCLVRSAEAEGTAGKDGLTAGRRCV